MFTCYNSVMTKVEGKVYLSIAHKVMQDIDQQKIIRDQLAQQEAKEGEEEVSGPACTSLRCKPFQQRFPINGLADKARYQTGPVRW